MEKSVNKNAKQYLVSLYKWRSVVTLVACFIHLSLSLYALFTAVINDTNEGYQDIIFQYYTNLSNFFNVIVSGFIFPYAIDGVRKKRFTYPRWCALLHLSATICISITTCFTTFFISWYNPELAFGGPRILLHFVCPLLMLVSFFFVDPQFKYSVKDIFVALIPFLAYALIYLLNVVFLKTWEDHYHLTTILPAFITFPGMMIMGAIVGLAIRFVHNRLADYRDKKLMASWKDDLSPVEIKIEAYGLGRYSGLNEDKNNINLNLDILDKLSKKYNIKLEELTRAYSKGVIDGCKENPLSDIQ